MVNPKDGLLVMSYSIRPCTKIRRHNQRPSPPEPATHQTAHARGLESGPDSSCAAMNADIDRIVEEIRTIEQKGSAATQSEYFRLILSHLGQG
jgi:hypothetical protein